MKFLLLLLLTFPVFGEGKYIVGRFYAGSLEVYSSHNTKKEADRAAMLYKLKGLPVIVVRNGKW